MLKPFTDALRRLVAPPPEDHAALSAAALAAVESGDDAELARLARRIADNDALRAVHALASDAQAKREAEAQRIADEAKRAARWEKIKAAVDEREAAAIEAERAIDALAAAWSRVDASSKTIASLVEKREVDVDAALLRSFDREAALRAALSRHAVVLGVSFMLPPLGGAPQPSVDARFSRSNAEILSRMPAPVPPEQANS